MTNIRFFYHECDWIGKPKDEQKFNNDIDIYSMNMPLIPSIEHDLAEKVGTKNHTLSAIGSEGLTLDQTKINVYVDTNEPDWYSPYPEDVLLEKAHFFDAILTRRPKLLGLPNSTLFLYGTHWVPNYESVHDIKQDSVSYTMTGKTISRKRHDDLKRFGVKPPDGYYLRHIVGKRFQDLCEVCKLPLRGYDSSNSPSLYPGLAYTLSSDHDGKLELMKSKFHIAIENTALPNYMTEKLHDCFLTKTVPIYYGCPTVSDFYNMDGILTFNKPSELVEILSNLTPETYDKMSDAIEDNYQRFVASDAPFRDRFYDAVLEVLNRK